MPIFYLYFNKANLIHKHQHIIIILKILYFEFYNLYRQIKIHNLHYLSHILLKNHQIILHHLKLHFRGKICLSFLLV